jgi:hypothetical protein
MSVCWSKAYQHTHACCVLLASCNIEDSLTLGSVLMMAIFTHETAGSSMVLSPSECAAHSVRFKTQMHCVRQHMNLLPLKCTNRWMSMVCCCCGCCCCSAVTVTTQRCASMTFAPSVTTTSTRMGSTHLRTATHTRWAAATLVSQTQTERQTDTGRHTDRQAEADRGRRTMAAFTCETFPGFPPVSWLQVQPPGDRDSCISQADVISHTLQ